MYIGRGGAGYESLGSIKAGNCGEGHEQRNGTSRGTRKDGGSMLAEIIVPEMWRK